MVFGRFGIFTWPGGRVGLELSFILMQTIGRFDMWVTPYTGIQTLAKLKYFMSKDLSTKTYTKYKVALLLITQGDIQSMEQEISSVKVKPDRPIQNFDYVMNFWWLSWNWD